ncbi:MAG TPA: hypothetical protein VGL90_08320, partial [Casimicrobiaceae bacterium]
MQQIRSGYRTFVWLLAVVLAIAMVDACAAANGPVYRAAVAARLASVRVPFVANTGQADRRVSYYAPTFAGTVYVARDGHVVYALPGGKVLEETAAAGVPHPTALVRAPTRVAYFVGRDPRRWRRDVPTFDTISLGEAWPHIRLDLGANGGSVEKRFTVLPGGDPSRIRMHVAGGDLRVDAAGALIVATAGGDVTFTAPIAFQERNGVRHRVRVAYALHGRSDY